MNVIGGWVVDNEFEVSLVGKTYKPIGWQLVTTDLLSNNIHYNMSLTVINGKSRISIVAISACKSFNARGQCSAFRTLESFFLWAIFLVLHLLEGGLTMTLDMTATRAVLFVGL